MANPLSNEKELYERIEREKMTIPDPIFELLEHHLGNDLYAIILIAGSRVTGEDKEPIPIADGEKIIKHVEEIRAFMVKMRKAVTHKK